MIDMLPDVAFLNIFDSYMDGEQIEAWHTLVHVCIKWRNIVFGSPRRLNLRLHCKTRTPVREMLDVWPLLPIVVQSGVHKVRSTDNIVAALEHKVRSMDNIVVALEHNDRICELDFRDISRSQFEKVLAAMQQPFPELTRTSLHFQPRAEAPVIPASFLGGFAPSLQELKLDHIPFPGLPKLLLSATRLVDLSLEGIPNSGYISPEAMVNCLSVLTSLKSLVIRFESRPDGNHRYPPPQTRTLLPLLTKLSLKGVSRYLEDLVARIDAPLLDNLVITFIHQVIFDTPQLAQFISRTPKFKTHDEARVVFSDRDVSVTFPQAFHGGLELGISCAQSNMHLSSLVQVCRLSFLQALISAVERLYILEVKRWWPYGQNELGSGQWLELFHSFTAVKGLYISWRLFALRIAYALRELVGERVTEVLPALETLFLEDPPQTGAVQEALGRFVATRHLTGHPIAVSRWKDSEGK
jgi:hypothetical protein